MTRFILPAILLIGAMLGLACSGGSTPTQPATDGPSHEVTSDSHVSWGIFDVQFDLEEGTAEIVWNRQAEIHANVTSVVTPPKCYDCMLITGAYYDMNALIFYLEIYMSNPTNLNGYDVRGVISSPGGDKYILNPDGVTSVWGAPMQFKAINTDPDRSFGPYEGHGTTFNFYFPPGESFATMTYIVDVSFPGPVEEPLIEGGIADPVINNNFTTTSVRATVWDHQWDVNPATVMVDLLALGGSPQTMMYDDGMHNDGVAGDNIYGTAAFTTGAPLGVYMVNIYAIDYAGHMGWGQASVPVQQSTGGPNEDPIINDVMTDRTTANGGANEKIKITVDAVDPDSSMMGFEYEASSGSFQGQNENYVWWKPATSNTGPQNITITVMDMDGGMDETQITLWSTNLSVVNGSTNGAIPGGTLQSVQPPATLTMDEDFMGEVCYMNFWATWCGYCVQEMPDLTAVYNQYKSNEDYNHCYINLKQTQSEIQNFINGNNYACSYWLMDSDGAYFNKCNDFNNNSTGIPQHVLFDRDGICRWSKIGKLSSTAPLEDAIDQLL